MSIIIFELPCINTKLGSWNLLVSIVTAKKVIGQGKPGVKWSNINLSWSFISKFSIPD